MEGEGSRGGCSGLNGVGGLAKGQAGGQGQPR